jgi:hypothetical protein
LSDLLPFLNRNEKSLIALAPRTTERSHPPAVLSRRAGRSDIPS